MSNLSHIIDEIASLHDPERPDNLEVRELLWDAIECGELTIAEGVARLDALKAKRRESNPDFHPPWKPGLAPHQSVATHKRE